VADNDIGYYTLPVILSMEGVEKQVSGKLSKVFGDVGKRAGASLAGGAEADVNRLTDAYGKLRDRASDALGKVRVEEQKLAKARAGGKSDQIVAAEERLAKARRDSDRVNRQALSTYGDLERAQKSLTESSGGLFSKLKGLGGAAATSGGEAASGFVDGFGGPIAALGTKAGPIGIALAATAGLGLLAGKVLADNILAGMGQLQEQANVAAKLGLSAEQVKPIASAAAEAYVDNFGSSITDNMDAARAAIQAGLLDPNATQAEVQKVVEQLSTVAQVTGEDIPAAVRSAQQAVRTGLAGSYTEAFDLIVKAQQEGLNTSGDLLDTLNEYGTQFRKLGLSGPEAMGLISQAVQGGARDTDVAADAIKEFSIRSIDGSKATGKAFHDLGMSWKGSTEALAAGGDIARDTFQDVIQRIAAIEDPAKRAQIQVALFGTQSEDLGNALNSMNLDTAAAEFGAVAGATQQAADTVGGTSASAIESAKRSIEVSVDGIQQALAEVFGPALQDLADWVSNNRGEIIGFFETLGHVAIDVGAFIVQSFGDAISSIGQIVQPLGDIQGAMLKFQAFQADFRGDSELAAQLREEAEAAFGWGEGLEKAGEAMKAVDPANLHKALDDAADKAKAATTETDLFSTEVDALDGKEVDIPIEVSGLDDASDEMDEFFEKYRSLSVGVEVGDAASAGALAGAALGAGIDLGVRGDVAGLNLATVEVSAQQFANNCISAAARIILSATDKVMSEVDVDQVIARGGSIDSLAAGLNKLNPQGQYVPMQGSGGSPEAMFAAIKESIDKGLGSVLNVAPGSSLAGTTFDYGHFIAVTGYDPATGRINLSDTADGSVYSVTPGEAFQASRGRGIVAGTGTGGSAPTALGVGNTAGIPLNLSKLPPAPTPDKPVRVTIANPPPGATPAAPPATPVPLPPMPIDTSRLTTYGPGGSPDLVNAFGPGYEPGIGTPGYDEYGKPGYFRSDEKATREAMQRAEDARAAIAEYDAAAQAARDARAALDDTPNVDATMIAGADEAVRKAETAAARARREAADAATDAAETAKGSFTAAREAEKQKATKAKKQSGGTDLGLGGLGSIASSFLGDTFGIGDWLPGLDNLFPLQAADTIMGALMGPITGFMEGGLNFQNPDWRQGMSAEDLAAANAASGFVPGSTSTAPFGIPDITAPPMPQNGQHGATGAAPGPAQNITIDQSQNFTNSPLGWDPAQVNKQRDRNINRAPRLPVGIGG
jgi:phage-related minor tail protein